MTVYRVIKKISNTEPGFWSTVRNIINAYEKIHPDQSIKMLYGTKVDGFSAIDFETKSLEAMQAVYSGVHGEFLQTDVIKVLDSKYS